jgi:hypothetical protein
MASTVTLLEMKTQARQRSDMENSTFISDDELTSYINSSIKGLYDKLLNAGEFYYFSSSDIPVVANTSSYTLPSDFYKLLGVDMVMDSLGNAVTLKPFQFEQRNSFLYTPTWNVVGLSYLRYMIQGNNLKFVPVPSGAATVRIYYAPSATNLSADTDTFDGINGFEEWVILNTAIKMLDKEESDSSALRQDQAMIERRLDEMKLMRDYGSPSKIGDVSRQMPWEFWSFGNIS